MEGVEEWKFLRPLYFAGKKKEKATYEGAVRNILSAAGDGSKGTRHSSSLLQSLGRAQSP